MVIPRWSVLRPPPRKAAAALMALALALSGCSGTNPDPGPLRGRVVLLVGLTQDDSFNAATRDVLTAHLDEVDRSFRAIHPGVSLQVQVFPEEEVVQEVRRRHRSGLGPDLLYVNGSTARQLFQAGLTRPVPLAPAVIEPLHPDAVRLMRLPDRRLVGAPVLLMPQLACFNKARLPTSPATLAELLALSDRGLRVGLPIDPVALSWINGPLGVMDSLVELARGQPLTPERHERIRSLVAWLHNADFRQQVSFFSSAAQLIDGLGRGQLDWISCRSSNLPLLAQRLGPRLGVAPLPSGPEGPASPLMPPRVLAFGTDSSADQRRAAEAIARFNLNPQMQSSFTLGTLHMVPANRLVPFTSDGSPLRDALVASYRMAAGGNALAQIVRTNDPVEVQARAVFNRLFYGDLDVNGATDALIQALQRGHTQ
jgi:ABC-type glycerol-3-phosphate transport system substrate-binding protein